MLMTSDVIIQMCQITEVSSDVVEMYTTVVPLIGPHKLILGSDLKQLRPDDHVWTSYKLALLTQYCGSLDMDHGFWTIWVYLIVGIIFLDVLKACLLIMDFSSSIYIVFGFI